MIDESRREIVHASEGKENRGMASAVRATISRYSGRLWSAYIKKINFRQFGIKFLVLRIKILRVQLFEHDSFTYHEISANKKTCTK